MNRLFNQRQRKILAWVSGGLCERCGARLTNSFHADHVVPYSKGGETITRNGQALCGPCNLKKGAKLC